MITKKSVFKRMNKRMFESLFYYHPRVGRVRMSTLRAPFGAHEPMGARDPQGPGESPEGRSRDCGVWSWLKARVSLSPSLPLSLSLDCATPEMYLSPGRHSHREKTACLQVGYTDWSMAKVMAERFHLWRIA